MSVVDLVKEERGSTDEEYIPQSSGGYITQSQPINFSIYVLFSTYSKLGHALEGLKYLSLVIALYSFCLIQTRDYNCGRHRS